MASEPTHEFTWGDAILFALALAITVFLERL